MKTVFYKIRYTIVNDEFGEKKKHQYGKPARASEFCCTEENHNNRPIDTHPESYLQV